MDIYELKDEYAKSCGAEDWYDHINGMSAKDVDEEIYYLFEFIKNKQLLNG